ncbi:YolD-like family protein [Laceyella putida]|uniref:YolD-like family protein n=1 Tax=Laceyella putida TaxID=110101 RepID=A0ABW2RID4_9BACL
MSALDRGNRLFTSMRIMLPEHVEALKLMKQEEYIPPEPDEQKWEEWDQMLSEAIENEKPIIVSSATKQGVEVFCGFLGKVDLVAGEMVLENGSIKKRVKLNRIVGIEWP